MTVQKIIYGDNIDIMSHMNVLSMYDVVYGDCIYESTDFTWTNLCYDLMKSNGIFFVQTDYHTVAEYKLHLDWLFGKDNFINWLIYIQEWGGVPKNAFPRKHDDILMYSKGKDYKFYRDRIQIPKVTAGSGMDLNNKPTKTPCDVFYDLGNFSTVSKERVKIDGTNFNWQKPLKLIERLLLPTTDEEDIVLDPFAGVGTVGVWCKQNNRNYVGIEYNLDLVNVAKNRIDNETTI